MFPGSHLKSPFLSPGAGRAETKAGGAEGRAERPLLEGPFQSWDRQEAPRAARAPAQHAGRALPLRARRPAASCKMTEMKTHSSPSQEGADAPASGLWADGRSDLPVGFPPPPGTRGRRRVRHCRPSRHVVLGATVAHSWPLQLLENERLFSLPCFPLPPPLFFFQAWNYLF